MNFHGSEQARLERLERQVSYLLQHLGVDPEVAAGAQSSSSSFGAPSDIFGASVPETPAFSVAPSAPPADPSGLSPAVLAEIRRGKEIMAIKQYRAETGLGLKEAKHVIDAYIKTHPNG